MAAAVTIRRPHLVAQLDGGGVATLDELVPLNYERAVEGLPGHVRAASALRRFDGRLVIVQDDVNALAVREDSGVVRAVLLPPHPSGRRVFDDTLKNKHEKLDLEACVTLPDGRLVAFGSGSLPARERLVVWDGRRPPVVVAASSLYGDLRAAVTAGRTRLNVEGAAVSGPIIKLFHRGNDVRGSDATASNAIVEIEVEALEEWLRDGQRSPRIVGVTPVELGVERGVPFGFTDAVALDADRIVVLACAEDSACAITDGDVLGCRVGLLDERGLRVADIYDAAGERTTLKIEGIERRLGSSTEFDVVVDVDSPSSPALLGRLVWEWR
jgi:hypothetical protein